MGQARNECGLGHSDRQPRLSPPRAAPGRYGGQHRDVVIVEYNAGALVEPAPVFDYNLGQSYRQLGKYREALWH